MWFADLPDIFLGRKGAPKNGGGKKRALPEKTDSLKRKAPPPVTEVGTKRTQLEKGKQVELPPPPKGPPLSGAQRAETLQQPNLPPSESLPVSDQLRPFSPMFRTDKGVITDQHEARSSRRVCRALMGGVVLPKNAEAVLDVIPEDTDSELFANLYRVRLFFLVP